MADNSKTIAYATAELSTDAGFRPLLHWLAILTCCATFPLICMGGLVTSHKAGMSVPDWPNSYGYNMFLFPPRLWIGGIFYEHTHRLMGTVVGILAIVLTIVAWKTEPRLWVRWLATSVLLGVIFQGVLGGLRVVLVKVDLAIVHACVAQAFFCLSAAMVVVTSRFWLNTSVGGDAGRARQIALFGVVCCGLIYLQLIVGATMRHYGAGLAIPDFPKMFGQWSLPVSAEDLGRAREFSLLHNLDAPSLFQIHIHLAHRMGAVAVTIATFGLSFFALRARAMLPELAIMAVALIGLIVTQVTLGIATVLLRKPADVASAHVAVGALTLVTAFVLTLRSMRLYSRGTRAVRAQSQDTGTIGLLQPAHS